MANCGLVPFHVFLLNESRNQSNELELPSARKSSTGSGDRPNLRSITDPAWNMKSGSVAMQWKGRSLNGLLDEGNASFCSFWCTKGLNHCLGSKWWRTTPIPKRSRFTEFLGTNKEDFEPQRQSKLGSPEIASYRWFKNRCFLQIIHNRFIRLFSLVELVEVVGSFGVMRLLFREKDLRVEIFNGLAPSVITSMERPI